MSRRGHIPLRTCLGCGARSPQIELIRLASTAGRIGPDPARRIGGRGGYLHGRAQCWASFAKRKGVVRSLGVALDRTERAAVVAELQQRAAQ